MSDPELDKRPAPLSETHFVRSAPSLVLIFSFAMIANHNVFQSRHESLEQLFDVFNVTFELNAVVPVPASDFPSFVSGRGPIE